MPMQVIWTQPRLALSAGSYEARRLGNRSPASIAGNRKLRMEPKALGVDLRPYERSRRADKRCRRRGRGFVVWIRWAPGHQATL